MDADSVTKLLFLLDSVHSFNTPLLLAHYLNESESEISQDVLILFQQQKHYRMNIDEDWITKYLEYDFFQLFRMNQETFNKLLDKINHPDLNKSYEGGGIPIPAYKQLLITLWWLGKGETLISTGEHFQVHPSTVFKCTEQVLDQILLLINKYICWPTLDEMYSIQEDFQNKCGFPGVIGAIDGTNIKFKAPEDQQESFIDKNGNHSIKLQAIGTGSKLLTNIFAGFPGSAHDKRIFTNSGIYLDITNNGNRRKYFPVDEFHLLGDKAYPLLTWLLVPYKNYGHLTQRQITYNTKHSRTRIKIEHIFGYLKGRWRILQYINVNSVKKAVKIIVACCILHNFCYINSDFWDEVVVEENEDDDDNDFQQIHHDQAAQIKRREIANLLFRH